MERGGETDGWPLDCAWFEEGRLAACAYPRDAATLAELARRGVTLLVNLHHRGHDPALLARLGLAELRLPVADFTPPSLAQLAEGVAAIDRTLAAGGRVAVHCRVGLGRTGTLLACHYVRRGLSPDDAIAHVRVGRPGAIETPEQAAAVAAFARNERLP